MVNLVIVSHSARLGEGVGELARQMLINDGCKLAIAAGIVILVATVKAVAVAVVATATPMVRVN